MLQLVCPSDIFQQQNNLNQNNRLVQANNIFLNHVLKTHMLKIESQRVLDN